ncbi:uncharacterized protein [Saccopteryx leptura]|uniref:uncharacterized protein n=1 Tax=Saccopteryx leptura TaxID=249018 RepID=UPI00339CE2AC
MQATPSFNEEGRRLNVYKRRQIAAFQAPKRNPLLFSPSAPPPAAPLSPPPSCGPSPPPALRPPPLSPPAQQTAQVPGSLLPPPPLPNLPFPGRRLAVPRFPSHTRSVRPARQALRWPGPAQRAARPRCSLCAPRPPAPNWQAPSANAAQVAPPQPGPWKWPGRQAPVGSVWGTGRRRRLLRLRPCRHALGRRGDPTSRDDFPRSLLPSSRPRPVPAARGGQLGSQLTGQGWRCREEP